ncbi:MAG: T9SS type A sorting domain-containing protein [Sphingobacteriaceae bacterium]|nr:T9SS type A sorting domain-containing protein [Sphingobacteriaceae bacterium]
MKKHNWLILFALFIFGSASAKKVKFAVDMGSYTISPNGIHVMGDFQVAAGYSLNFDPASILMTQVGATTIYTVIVTLPAFQKYEFKFVNGDQSYEVEFVPEKARVGYNFNDNRWMFVDSLQNDTSFLGAVKFSENSPAGKTLLRYVVDMQYATPVPTTGVHLGSTYQGNDPATTRLTNLDGTKYEIIAYLNTGVQSFKYYNGNNAGTTETVPGACATSSLRTHNLQADTILPTVCFSSCTACMAPPASISENSIQFSRLKISPNPASDYINIIKPNQNSGTLAIVDISGKLVKEIKIEDELTDSVNIDISDLSNGVYQIYFGSQNQYFHTKLIKN